MAAQVMEVCSLHSSSRRGSAATPKASDAVGHTGHQRRQRCGCDSNAWCGHCETGRRAPCGRVQVVRRLQQRQSLPKLHICAKFREFVGNSCALFVSSAFCSFFTAVAACTSSLKCICALHINIMFHSSALHLIPLYCTRTTVCLFSRVSTLCVAIVCSACCDCQ